ncbi:uncharacterized protein LOC127259791 isoform X2 [Andrographis paniculata]|uniref:uncharacterized protein LOC127259791 isoform X2 n=1 Tax=Andrographis paniculata TaxID=175694 RepID=UPI0021E977C9|nr:uncharacterized protein LOC127259791 isoform X2 [Andrographis paniculata]
MSDEGDKTCPLCAEEMDLTDQQLKPCKCGYEICVWCWHHIMDMAEKDETEGRCPACRTPYNKEKIVGTAASCGRLVSESNVEKKKSHKVKSKTSEGRKQLASVRVIQKNLVYVVGLPLTSADEDLLQRKEYFGQYGKVLKVSISRTSTGAIQHSANSTCSVYITYSREDEAVRCIQSVHGFVLEGRSLRACFGTTKYCHAWLRNMPCSNPDCLYLHEIGSQEDSFTKDEIISAYSSCRVQRITGSSNSTQRRSGNVLPPPADEYCNNAVSSGRPIPKPNVNTNNPAVNARVSPPNSSSGRSAALPAGASWGTRASNNQSSLGSVQQYSNGPHKQKLDLSSGQVSCSTVAESPMQSSSLSNDTGKTMFPNEESPISLVKRKFEISQPPDELPIDKKLAEVESSATVHSSDLSISTPLHSSASTNVPPNGESIVESSVTSSGCATDNDSIDAPARNVEKICSDILSMGISEQKIIENSDTKHVGEPVSSGMAPHTGEEIRLTYAQSDGRLEMPTQETQKDLHETENDIWAFDKQRLKDPEIASFIKPNFSHTSPMSKYPHTSLSQFSSVGSSVGTSLDRQVVDRNNNLIVSASTFPSGHTTPLVNGPEVKDIDHSKLSKERLSLRRYEGEPASGAFDIGESSIISNILSLDFDPWDETVNSPQNLATLIGKPEKLYGGFGASGSLKIQNSNQSRFSFAREEEPKNQIPDHGQSMDYFERGLIQHSLGNDLSSENGLQLEKFVNRNGFPFINAPDSGLYPGSHSDGSSNRFSAVSRSHISAPPGFSAPSRPPPPGFASHDRIDQNLGTASGNHMLDVSSLLSNHYQAPSLAGNNTITNGDIEFMDPAILAVGKGMLPGSFNSPSVDVHSSLSSQLNTYEEARFRSFLRSLPPHQSQRFPDVGDGYSSLGDAYGIHSRFLEQKMMNNASPISQFTFTQSRNGLTSHGQLDGWGEIQGGNHIGMAELLRTERLGLNKFYGGYEDSKIRTPSSGNLYNGTYGI